MPFLFSFYCHISHPNTIWLTTMHLFNNYLAILQIKSGLSVPNFEDWNLNSSDSSMPTSSFATPRINRPPDPSLAPQYPRYPTSPFPRLPLPGAFPSQSQQQNLQSLDPSRHWLSS